MRRQSMESLEGLFVRPAWETSAGHRDSVASMTESAHPDRGANAMLDRMRAARAAVGRLDTLLRRQQPWYAQRKTHLVTLLITLLLCILSIVYPSRNVDALVNIPFKENQAGRQLMTQVAISYYARELVIADGFSRLTPEETAAALEWSIQLLKDADHAVRMGGTMGTTGGSETGLGRVAFNEYMYATGCPWREEVPNTTTCTLSSKPDIPIHGLNGLQLAFIDAAEAVLAKYAPDGRGDFRRLPDNATLGTADVVTNMTRISLLASDPDLAFLMENFDGDLSLAVDGMLGTIDVEHDLIFEMLHSEGRLLYGIFIMQICVVFYLIVFRSTFRGSQAETSLVRRFVERLPAFVLECEEIEDIRLFFVQRQYDQIKTDDD